jgi:hypothetical protein
MDEETKKILSNQMRMAALVGSEGWPIARQILVDRILSLQDAFTIEADEPQKMFMDLGARKMAVLILTDTLREIEGMAQEIEAAPEKLDEGYVVEV